MEPTAAVSLQEGAEESYVLFWPPTDTDPGEGQFCQAMVVMKREGGFLLAVPTGFVPMEELQGASSEGDESLLGPHTVLTVPGVFVQGAELVPAGMDLEVQLVDLSDRAYQGLLLASHAAVPEEQLVGFGADPSLCPDPATLLRYALEWVRLSAAQRMVFYSAEEEAQPETVTPKQQTKAKAKRASTAQQTAEHISAMAKLMPAMAQQIADLQKAQRELQEVVRGQTAAPAPRPSQMPVAMSPQQFVSILGSPPKVKGLSHVAPPPKKKTNLLMDSPMTLQEQAEEAIEEAPTGSQDPLAAAMLEQSRALTALVSHMQQGDPLIEGHASGSSVSSRGAQGRERLQKELTNKTGGFFLTVMQNMHRRMKPASPVPASLEELAMTDLSMVSYLERFGGYGGVRDMGIAQYALAFIVDMAMRGDLEGVQENLALLVVGREQYAQDGKWDLGFLLTLLEDPPPQMWSYRNPVGVQTGRLRAFAPLCPQKWATISLAYLKEIDFIQNRRSEVTKKDTPFGPKPLQPVPQTPKKKWGGKGPKAKAAVQNQQEGQEEM